MGRAEGRPHALRRERLRQGRDARGPAPGRRAVDGKGIAVAVYNGTTVPGLAARAAQTLGADGFAVTGTATAASQDNPVTLIQYGAGDQAGARLLARLFPGARLELTTAPGIDVVLGADYAAAPSAAASPAGTPTALPTADAGNARTADEDPCQDLTYGSGG